ncbi:unnamed protein product [Pleuronectes platessa]|uniref:Uncharacterized protein n=1 Tax=Pleuronectes platessa TaxID=8262 RepID=A0A9N7W0B6_PLEPL|nr:unnamed protein product [Pleuronectes platessa]
MNVTNGYEGKWTLNLMTQQHMPLEQHFLSGCVLIPQTPSRSTQGFTSKASSPDSTPTSAPRKHVTHLNALDVTERARLPTADNNRPAAEPLGRVVVLQSEALDYGGVFNISKGPTRSRGCVHVGSAPGSDASERRWYSLSAARTHGSSVRSGGDRKRSRAAGRRGCSIITGTSRSASVPPPPPPPPTFTRSNTKQRRMCQLTHNTRSPST